MKVVQLVTAIQLGGAEKIAFEIASNINSKKIDIQFLTIFKCNSNFSKTMKKNLLNDDIPYTEQGLDIANSKLKYISLVVAIIQTLFFFIKHKPDIVHSHTDFPDFVLSCVLKIQSFLHITTPKIVRTIHNTVLWPTHHKLAKFVEESFIDDDVVYISSGSKKAYYLLRKKCNLAVSKNSHFVYNGIDFTKYTDKCNQGYMKKNNIKIDKNKINFLYVGRFVQQKGFDILLDAFHKLDINLEIPYQLSIIGSGELESLLSNEKYTSLPISVYPASSDLEHLYACFDYLVMPSRFEGLPLVAIESLSSALPVIASRAPGLEEAIPND